MTETTRRALLQGTAATAVAVAFGVPTLAKAVTELDIVEINTNFRTMVCHTISFERHLIDVTVPGDIYRQRLPDITDIRAELDVYEKDDIDFFLDHIGQDSVKIDLYLSERDDHYFEGSWLITSVGEYTEPGSPCRVTLFADSEVVRHCTKLEDNGTRR